MVAREDYEKAKTYSQLTGVPVTRVIGEAISDWFETVGNTRMEIMTGQIINVPVEATVIEMPLPNSAVPVIPS